jgi:crotonobetainyl-CoA:carnitine CoA-transferase CaiB-like acyl-CoA transferase
VLGRPALASDARFADRHARKAHRAELTQEIEQALAARSAAEWERLLVEAGVPAGGVLSVPEILNHPHLAQRRFLKRFRVANRDQSVTRCGFRLADGEPEAAGPPPTLSQHTEQTLRTLGYGAAEIEQLRAQGTI